MRVLLIKPVMADGPYELPLNLAYLASALLAAGNEAEIHDLHLSDWDSLRDRLESGVYDVVGTTTYSYSLSSTARICEMVRADSPGSTLVLGGPHATFAPKDTFERFPYAQAILRGESEMGLVRLCDMLKEGRSVDSSADDIPNLATRAVEGAVVRPTLPLDNIRPASEAFHLLDIMASLQRNPYMPMLASRGCPYSCAFCLSPYMWGGLRLRSWPNLRRELVWYLDSGFRQINFLDDVFSLLRPLLPRLLTFLKEHDVKWGCETRLDDMNEEKVSLFAESGMERIRVSVESIHTRSLAHMRKNADLRRRRERIKALTGLCPDVRVSFMVGIPGETVDDVRATMDCAETLLPAKCKFWAYSPLPGTPIYNDPQRHGIVQILAHDQYHPLVSYIETDCMTNEQINELLRECHKRFHQQMREV